jgi:gamma-glutamyl:cysteine ligase YbdK (ATP-grasp superfamily)
VSGDREDATAGPGLFEAFGVEIEAMLVDAATLAVRPECDRLMERVGGSAGADVELGDIAWSNELTLHVLEQKTNGPAPTLAGLASKFHEGWRRAGRELEAMGARLMPGGVHPWMDPHTETVLWPHEYTEVYHTFDRIFGCSGHGWANLQSTHLNLPFRGDEEFARLHAAIRLVLPLLPAISAASPYLDGVRSPALDARLVAYRGNARRVPSVSGLVVPEPAFTREQYEREILGRIYADMAPLDPEGTLRHEWANARGAIARFDRGTVEVRVIDAQECPSADLAVVAAVTEVVRALAIGPLSERDFARDPSTEALAGLLEATIADGERAPVAVPGLAEILGLGSSPRTAGEVWSTLLDRYPPQDPGGEWTGPLETILRDGPLARRLVAALGDTPDRTELAEVYGRLCACLEENRAFCVR